MREIITVSGEGVGRSLARSLLAVAALGVALAGCTAQGPEPAVVTVTAPPSDLAPTSTPAERSAVTDADPQVDARVVDHLGNRYEVVTLPLDEWDTRVDWDSQAGGVMLADLLAADPGIAVATNAGIFTPEFAPGGSW